MGNMSCTDICVHLHYMYRKWETFHEYRYRMKLFTMEEMNRLNLITLGVNDMQESLAFYRDGLGFEVVVHGEENNPSVIFFNNAGT